MNFQPVSKSMKTATRGAIERIALATATQATGQRQLDAIAHCQRLGLLGSLPDSEILGAIERQQAIQKRNPVRSQEWRNASARLRPLFEEMARRQNRD